MNRFIFVPYHRSTNLIAQSAFWSAWQRLQAFGMFNSLVRSGSGMVNPWSWRECRCIYTVTGMWHPMHSPPLSVSLWWPCGSVNDRRFGIAAVVAF